MGKNIFNTLAVFAGLLLSSFVLTQTPAGAADNNHDRQPLVSHAERSLHEAKTALEHSKDDLGGHKAKALEAIAAAIQELQEARASAKTTQPTPKR